MEKPPQTTLSALPREILQQISTYLPPSTVISLLLVSHSLRKAVDHWAVWRSFITGNLRFLNGIPLAGEGGEGDRDREGRWKRYVLADILARRWEDSRRRLEERDLRWLPMLLVIGHPILRTLTPDMVMHLAIPPSGTLQTETPLFEIPPRKGGEDQKAPMMFPTNPETALSLEEWQSKVAGSFCLAMTHMSTLALQQEEVEELRLLQEQNDSPQDDDEDIDSEIETPPGPIPQLCKIPWFNFNPRDPSLSPEKREILITALHALSLTALAHFSTEFEFAISQYRIASTTISQVSHPPTSKTISRHLSALTSNSSMPSPFAPSCIENFGTSHLSIMATEDFFEDGEWTGAFAYTGLWGVMAVGSLGRGRDVFDCVGGVNRMARLGGWDEPGGRGKGRGGVVIEGCVRFRRVESREFEGEDGWPEMDGENESEEEQGRKDKDVFTVRSNSFYSQMGTHILELRVQRSTGLIAVMELDAHGVGKEGRGDGSGSGKGKGKSKGNCRGAVLTPFGIVGAMGVGASWMWLWKREWSGAVEGAD